MGSAATTGVERRTYRSSSQPDGSAQSTASSADTGRTTQPPLPVRQRAAERVRNGTVHASLVALDAANAEWIPGVPGGLRATRHRFTRLYMGVIAPFRRWSRTRPSSGRWSVGWAESYGGGPVASTRVPEPIDYLNPDLPPGLERVVMPVVDATPASLEGYGRLVEDPSDCRIEIVRWPAQGTRPVDAGTGDQGGTTAGVFASEWRGDILYGRNDAVGGHYILAYANPGDCARGPSRASAAHDALARELSSGWRAIFLSARARAVLRPAGATRR